MSAAELAAAIASLKTRLNLPKEWEQVILPPSIHNMVLPDYFPKSGDLVDGALVALGITILRLILITFVLTPCARRSMKHVYYKTKKVARLEEVFR